MRTSQADAYAAKRDLWLCFARAFAPPAAGSFHDAFVRDLPEDLAAISTEIGLNIAAELDEFVAAARLLPNAMELQRSYAALFVTPPVPVFLNTGIYLDGAFLGPSESDLNTWYARHGYERHADFRDLNDHAAVQFEFAALLYDKAVVKALAHEDMEAVAYATEAERFLKAFPKRWITAFIRTLETAVSERAMCSVYLRLAKMVWLSMEYLLQENIGRVEVAPDVDFPEGSSRGMGPLAAEDLAQIALRLEAAGLDYAHIKALPEWREDVLTARRAAAQC